MEKIKLIIWDLDDTFWMGTLSDGDIQVNSRNVDFIKHTTDLGIVNSICSKNDYERTKKKLIELEMWDYFVFSSIDWSNKGNRIANIINDMNLRPINVLFVDDNINNLEEAKYITPELNVVLARDFYDLIEKEHAAFEGKTDTCHTRLKQYKMLEKRVEQRNLVDSNEDFLFQSDIFVEIDYCARNYLDRIYEMIHRNNQLNYTKNRISKDEVNSIFCDNDITSGIVKVSDKFGNHGIVGCFAVKEGKAIQFVFSCRILGMGVEQWVYSELDFPDIEVVGDVAVEINKTERPEWINQKKCEKCDLELPERELENKLLVYGYCPLRPIWAYLEPKLPNAVFNLINPQPPVCNLAVLFRENELFIENIVNNVNMFDKEASFDKKLLNGYYDSLLISFTNENICFKNTEKESGKVFYSAKKLSKNNCSEKIVGDYISEPITLEDIEKEFEYLCNSIPEKMSLYITNVSEVEFSSKGKDTDYWYRVKINEIVERIARKRKNTYIIDMKSLACHESDFFEPLANHYNRAIGYKAASEILNYMGVDCDLEKVKTTHTCSKSIKQLHEVAEFKFVSELNIVNGELIFDFSCITSNNAEHLSYKFTVVNGIIKPAVFGSEKPAVF